MSRYIDADAFKRNNEDLLHCDFPYLCEDTLEEIIDEEPTADVVEVVRCEDCKHSHYFIDAHTDNYGTSVKAKAYCRIWQDWVPPEGYCFLADMRGGTDDTLHKDS